MANLRDIKRRIGSVENTQKITSALKLASAPKLRRATLAVEAARPYAVHMRATLEDVARGSSDAENALMTPHDEVRTLGVVVVTSDRGLAGAFNNQIIKRVDRMLAERADVNVKLYLVGRKVNDFFKKRRPKEIELAELIGPGVTYAQAAAIARQIAHSYEEGELDQVLIVFNEFVTTMTQRPTTQQLLPIVPSESEEEAEEVAPYEIEPDAQRLLAVLAPKALEIQIFRAMLESQAGEHAARMTAMESATRNSEELIESLTLQYNRARQAAITRELVEIVSGAEAL